MRWIRSDRYLPRRGAPRQASGRQRETTVLLKVGAWPRRASDARPRTARTECAARVGIAAFIIEFLKYASGIAREFFIGTVEEFDAGQQGPSREPVGNRNQTLLGANFKKVAARRKYRIFGSVSAGHRYQQHSPTRGLSEHSSISPAYACAVQHGDRQA